MPVEMWMAEKGAESWSGIFNELKSRSV